MTQQTTHSPEGAPSAGQRHAAGQRQSAGLSPLGELYRRAAHKATEQWPHLDARQVDRLVSVALARVFLDCAAAELAQAITEGSLWVRERAADQTADYIGQIVADALDRVADERT